MSESGHDPLAVRGEGGVSATEALTGVSMPGDRESLGRARLTAMVAAALRTALDRMIGDLPVRRPIVAGGDEDVLEVRLDVVDDAGLSAAGEVLESAGGSLGPSERRRGAWVVRVPMLVERPTYLMVEQGTLGLAVPWSAVARVRMMPSDAIDAMARRNGWAVLPRFADDGREAAERPVVVIARGLKRGCLIADRLVWRLPAEPVDPAPAGAQLARAVRTADGDVWRVVEPEPLLRDVWPMPLPAPARAASRWQAPVLPMAAPAPAVVAEPVAAAVVVVAPPPVPAVEVPAPAPLAPTVALVPDVPLIPAAPLELGPEHVGPLELGPEDVHPIEHQAGVPVGRALVAEDSITARIFLERLLQRRGFEVVAVENARALRAALQRPDWSVVFVDVDLPDARGAQHLGEVAGLEATVVALVRDAADERVAAAQGITRTLRKPFDADALGRLLAPPPAQAV